MTKFSFKINFIIVSVFAAGSLAGCGSQTETSSDTTNSANRPAANSAPSANTNTIPQLTASTPAAGNNAVSSGKKPSQPPANIPQTKIGSGGNDFSLLASVRAALSDDKELLNGVIVEAKEGEVTLNGKVSSEEQKKKAEQLARGVQGIKNLKNNLRVSP